MKLRDRKIISSDFQVQKKLQIDEGVALARRVDALRETLTSLEAQHKKFIAGMRQDLLNQTKVLESTKSAVQGEVCQLEERRKELLKPLDDEWAKLAERQSEQIKKLSAIHNKEDELKLKEKDIEKVKKQTEEAWSVANNREVETGLLNQRIKEDTRSAKVFKDTAEQERNTQRAEFSKVNAQLTQQTKDILVQQRYINLAKETLEVRKKDLDDRERAINDKYETLQRTINRLKQ